MNNENIICTSCKTRIGNMVATAKFKCPKCGKIDIIRCEKCRKLGTKYICQSCNFEGPN